MIQRRLPNLTDESNNMARRSTPPRPTAPTVKKAARDLTTFRATHDPSVKIPRKIQAGLDRLKREHGAEAYAYEQSNLPGDDCPIPPMVKLADVSTAHLVQCRAQFLQHIVKVQQETGTRRPARMVWFATTAAAFEARGRDAELSDLE